MSKYKLLDWIPLEKILTKHLSSNPHTMAINILKEHPEYIDFNRLCMNPCIEAFDIIINNLDKIMVCSLCAVENINIVDVLENKLNKKQKKRYDWTTLSSNPYAILLLEKNFEKINWHFFSSNCNLLHAIPIIEKNLNLVDMEQVAHNPNIIHIIDKIIDNDNMDWDLLSQNPSMVEYFDKNWNKVKDKINWTYFSRNQNINAIKILEQNFNKINWETLSENINACDLIEKNWAYCKDKIDWC